MRGNGVQDAVHRIVLEQPSTNLGCLSASEWLYKLRSPPRSPTHQHLAEVLAIGGVVRRRDCALRPLGRASDFLPHVGERVLERSEVAHDRLVGDSSQELRREGRSRRDGLARPKRISTGRQQRPIRVVVVADREERSVQGGARLEKSCRGETASSASARDIIRTTPRTY